MLGQRGKHTLPDKNEDRAERNKFHQQLCAQHSNNSNPMTEVIFRNYRNKHTIFFRLRKQVPASTVIRTVYSQVTKPSSTQTARAKTLPDSRDHHKGPNTTQHRTARRLIRMTNSHGDTQNNTKQQRLVHNSLKNVPSGPMEECQSDRLQQKAPSLHNVSPIIVRKDNPTSDPENSPKDHLQNRYIL
jgi:hypothetical protein